jgi:hypothetical protein
LLDFSSCKPITILGASFPITFPGDEKLLAVWDYAGDNQRWIASGFFGAVPPTPGYPAGTDLGGALWMHGHSTRGNVQHGLPPGPCIGATICSIADHYVPALARRQNGRSHRRGGDSFIVPPIDSASTRSGIPIRSSQASRSASRPRRHDDPASLEASYWLVGAQRGEADDLLTPKLRASFTDSSVRWVAASEAATNTQLPALGRAVLVAADGTDVVDWLVRARTGFRLGLGDRGPEPDVPPALATLASTEGRAHAPVLAPLTPACGLRRDHRRPASTERRRESCGCERPSAGRGHRSREMQPRACRGRQLFVAR